MPLGINMDQFIRGFKHFFEGFFAWITPNIDWYGVGVTFGLITAIAICSIGILLLSWCIGKVFKNADDT